jgi:hypothetical protein
MKSFAIVYLLLLALVLGGCTTKSNARKQRMQAQWIGQQQGMAEGQTKSLSVMVVGNVANHTIPWTIDLTLAKAFIAASYQGVGSPTSISVTRKGEIANINPVRVLRGYDFALEPGDKIELSP